MYYVNFGSVTAVGILFAVLGCLSLGLRMHMWCRHIRQFQAEEFMALIATVIMIVGGVGMAIGGQFGFIGGHSPDQALEFYVSSQLRTQKNMEIFEYALFVALYPCIGLAKLSILLWFRRLFRSRDCYWTLFDYTNWALIGLVTGWMLAFGLAMIFECRTSFWAAWSTVADIPAHCLNGLQLDFASTVIDGVVDVLILIEPLAVVGSLKRLDPGQKIQLGLNFLLATAAVAVALAKMGIWIEVANDSYTHPKPFPGLATYDDWGIISTMLFWTYLEMGVGCVVACLLPCRRYFGHSAASRMGLTTTTDQVSLTTMRSVNPPSTKSHGNKSDESHLETQPLPVPTTDFLANR